LKTDSFKTDSPVHSNDSTFVDINISDKDAVHGFTSSSIPSVIVRNAIDDLLDSVRDKTPRLNIFVDSSPAVDQVDVALDAHSLSDLAKDGSLYVATDLGRFTLNNSAFGELISKVRHDDVTFSIAVDDKLELSAAQTETIDGDFAFNIDILKDDQKVSDFDNPITITLEYFLPKNHDPNSIQVYHVAEDGTLEALATTYSETLNEISFDTNHFSIFMVDSTVKMPFIDVTASDWFFDDVEAVFDQGIMVGMTDTQFIPLANSTRAQIAAILYRLSAAEEDPAQDEPWYASAVNWAADHHLFNMYGNSFRPDNTITREELVNAVYNYAIYMNADVTKTMSLNLFRDSMNVSPWAVNAMEWAVANEIIFGKDNTILDPQGFASRSEIAAIVNRLLKLF